MVVSLLCMKNIPGNIYFNQHKNLTVMEKLVSCCGLDCAACDARIATINDDDVLRKATAEKWATMYNVPDMSPSMINCTGCRNRE